MRWTILLLNLLAAAGLQFLAALALSAHRTHVYSTYRELAINRVLVESPAYNNGEPLDVEARLQSIGSGGYYQMLANVGSAACLLTGLTFFLLHKPLSRTHVTAAPPATAQ
ncbi:MAG: hypothetical protein JNG86_02865 [Verrucomicrobiaceae bacterium]|nr:hypothetical protein [Verrucomicrobiaceae bacterium]